MPLEESARHSILVVDDTETNIDILVDLLSDDYDVSVAMDGESALQAVEDNAPDLILLDIMMPGMDGYEVCKRLKADEKTRDIPVIFVTAMNDIEDEARGFEVGAVDFIIKPVSPPIVKSRVKSQLSLKDKTEKLSALSSELSKYLSPQIYNSIFSGERSASIESQRKKLSIFFSDIVSFTSITERMEAEDISGLLNEYLNAMANIAIKYGGTIDKFVGDAVMVFFGDPSSRGVKDDALACVSMALEMMDALKDLQKDWYLKGVTDLFKIRVGINTGFCTVGNFGSSSKMDYTIIGGQVNIAKRLEEIAEEGKIIISHETWSHIKDEIYCIKQKPVYVKGIPNPIKTYQVEGFHDKVRKDEHFVSIGSLIEEAEAVESNLLVGDLNLGRRMDDSFEPVVVVEDHQPVGLLMNYQITRLLSSHSNRAKFFEQPVKDFMDNSPMIVDRSLSLNRVAQQAMVREKNKLYDDIIVIEEGTLKGTVPVHALLKKLVSLQDENESD